MKRAHRFGSLALIAALIMAMLPAVAPPVSVSAQSGGSVEEAVQERVAALTGGDPGTVTVVIVADDGDWYYGTATDTAINVRFFLSHRTTDGFEVAFRGDDEFPDLLGRAPAGFPSADIRSSFDSFTLAGDASTDLSLPWPVGEWRRISNVSALNPYMSFTPVTYGMATYAHNLPILAMRGGTIYFPCSGVAMIDHGGGLATYYNHLTNSPFSAGQTVTRGAQIGVTSNAPTCRSTGTGSTIEVWITRHGQLVNWNGIDVGGYEFSTSEGGVGGSWTNASGPGHSDMTAAPNRPGIPNLGVHGATDWPDAKITLDNAYPHIYIVSGFPPNTLVTMSWQRPDGSRVPMGTLITNAGGSNYGLFTPLDRLSVDYTKRDMLIAQAGSLIRMILVTPNDARTEVSGMSPSSGLTDYIATAGQVVTVSQGTSFPNTTFRLQMRDSLNSTHILSNSVTTDASGKWTHTFTIPTMPAGSATLQYVDATNTVHSVLSQITIVYERVVALSSNRGSGGPITVTLSGFEPNTELNLRYNSSYCTSSVITPVTTNAQGAASVSLTIPPGVSFRSINVYTAGLQQLRSVRYYYDETYEASVSQAAPGTTFNVVGTGIVPNYTYQVNWFTGLQWLTLASSTGDATTCSFSIPVTVPAAAAPGSTMFLRIVRVGYDIGPRTAQVVVTGTPVQALVANAGPDQTTSTVGTTTSVTLNGAGSTPSGLITSYSWRLAGVEIGATANPAVNLPAGVHEIELTVRDNANRVATDSVIVTVTSTNPASAQFTPNHAAVGGTASFTVSNFPPNTSVSVFRPSISGSGPALATVTTNPSGAATGQFTVPQIAGGAPLDFTFSASTASATAQFTIDPLFSITGTTPLIWTKNGAITASGFPASVPLMLEYQVGASWIAIPLVSPNTSIQGVVHSTFVVPNTITPGLTTFRLSNGAISQTTTRKVIPSNPPTANFSSISSSYTATGPDGYLLNVNGSNSSDSDGAIVSWVWSENGIELGTGATASFWLQVGTHTITLTVTDDSGISASTSRTTTINNVPPVANAGPDQVIQLGASENSAQVTLNGTLSSDVNGAITSYIWKMQDGTTIATSASPTVSLGTGMHWISLTVTDNHGGSNMDTVLIEVRATPTANAGPDQNLTTTGNSMQVSLNGSLSFTPAGSITYTWFSGSTNLGTGASRTVTLNVGTHTIRLEVTLPGGTKVTDEVTISITKVVTVNPAVALSANNGMVAGSIGVTITGFPANSVVTMNWYRANGTLVTGITLPSFTTNSSGSASGSFAVPAVPGGVNQKVRFTSGATTRDATFEVKPRISPSATSVAPGQGITLNLRGFAANTSVTIRWMVNGSYVTVGTVSTSATGSVTNKAITVPANASGGINTIRAEGGGVNSQTSSVTVISPAVSITPLRTTVNNRITYTVTNFPANSPVTITWHRLTGSTLIIDTVMTNASGAVTGEILVPAVTGGPNQPISFTSGGVSRTVLFEIAPRIKSNTTPGLRGQTIDFSLRGYAKQETVRVRWFNPHTNKWVDVGTGSTSNTGSANIPIVVPIWAADGDNSVRAETASFNQQTNAVFIQGGAPLRLSEEPEPTPEPTEEPDGSLEATPTPEFTDDPEPSPEPVEETPVIEPTPEPGETPEPDETPPSDEPPVAIEPEPTPLPEPDEHEEPPGQD